MNELEVSIKLINDKIQFAGTSRSNAEVLMDYLPPLGDGNGYTGLELLLMSLACCSSTSIVAILRKMHKNIKGFTVKAHGLRKEEHPTSFKKITLDFSVISNDTDAASMDKAILLSSESLCPVWCMLKHGVEINTTFKINS